jgi:ubiquinone/menaquinone biosynthesis C-methylase UbiE
MNIGEAFSLINNDRIPLDKAITRWADLGCGTGLFTQALSHMLQRGSSIHGIDNNRSLKRQTTPNGVEIIPLQLDFVTGDWDLQNLDGIVMANSFHYVKDKPAFLKKAQTYLKPQASILIVEYDTDTPVPTWIPYPLSFSSLTKLFIAEGYTSIQKLGERPSIYGGGNIYGALISAARSALISQFLSISLFLLLYN